MKVKWYITDTVIVNVIQKKSSVCGSLTYKHFLANIY